MSHGERDLGYFPLNNGVWFCHCIDFVLSVSQGSQNLKRNLLHALSDRSSFINNWGFFPPHFQFCWYFWHVVITNTYSEPMELTVLWKRCNGLVTNVGNAVKVKKKVLWGKNNRGLLGVSKFNHLLGLTERNVWLYACYDLLPSKVTQQISKGKACMGYSRECRHSFHASSPRGIAQNVPDSHGSKLWHVIHVKRLPRQVTGPRHSGCLLGVRYVGTLCLACMYPDSTLPQGKQVLGINHIICNNNKKKQFRLRGSHYQGLVKTLQKPTFPDTSQGSVFLRRAASGLLLSTLFYMGVSF